MNSDPSWAERYKPAAGARTHLLLAGAMWTVVGAALAAAGGTWLWSALPGAAPWLAGLAVVLGLAKSRVVLDRAARRIGDRIRERGDGMCLGGFLSFRTWGLVAAMAIGGRLLRTVPHVRPWVGFLYLAVGAALLTSSRIHWIAALAGRTTSPSSPAA